MIGNGIWTGTEATKGSSSGSIDFTNSRSSSTGKTNLTKTEYYPGLQWPINVLTQQPDCLRVCKRVWVACLSALLTVPVYDVNDMDMEFNFNDDEEDDDSSVIATIADECYIAKCSSDLQYRARYLVRKILNMSDREWTKGYISIVYEIAQLQASVDPHLALDMARMGLTAINSNLQLR